MTYIVGYSEWSLGGVLISLWRAIEPVGGYTTESVTHGQCDARPTVTFQPMAGTNLYCLVNRGTLCVNNLPSVVT